MDFPLFSLEQQMRRVKRERGNHSSFMTQCTHVHFLELCQVFKVTLFPHSDVTTAPVINMLKYKRAPSCVSAFYTDCAPENKVRVQRFAASDDNMKSAAD